MLCRPLAHHEPAACWNLKSTHDVVIPIRAAHKVENDRRRAHSESEVSTKREPTPMLPQRRHSIPIDAVETQTRSRKATFQSLQEGDTVRVATPYECHIGAEATTLLLISGHLWKMNLRLVAKLHVDDLLSACGNHIWHNCSLGAGINVIDRNPSNQFPG